MSYDQAMRWHKKHPTGGKPQYMGFATGSGFWPSVSWTEKDWLPYLAACEAIPVQPLPEKALYDLCLRGRIMSLQSTEQRAEYTRLMRIRAIAEPHSTEPTITIFTPMNHIQNDPEHGRIWHTTCTKCGTAQRIRIGSLTVAEARPVVDTIDTTPRECPGGYHTEASGWRTLWSLDAMLTALQREEDQQTETAIGKDLAKCDLIEALGDDKAKAAATEHRKACFDELKAMNERDGFTDKPDEELLAELGVSTTEESSAVTPPVHEVHEVHTVQEEPEQKPRRKMAHCPYTGEKRMVPENDLPIGWKFGPYSEPAAPEEPAATVKESLTVETLAAEYNQHLASGSAPYGPEMMQRKGALGAAIDPDIRLGDQQTLGEVYAMHTRGECTAEEFTRTHHDLRARLTSLAGIPPKFTLTTAMPRFNPLNPDQTAEPEKPKLLPRSMAIRLLAQPHEDQTGPAGDHNATFRQEILAALTGKKPAKAKAGIGIVRKTLAEHFHITDYTCGADLDDKIRDGLRSIIFPEFANTVPAFQQELQAIATLGGEPIEKVYAQWCVYAWRCHDQSALVSEFRHTYAFMLGLNSDGTPRERTEDAPVTSHKSPVTTEPAAPAIPQPATRITHHSAAIRRIPAATFAALSGRDGDTERTAFADWVDAGAHTGDWRTLYRQFRSQPATEHVTPTPPPAASALRRQADTIYAGKSEEELLDIAYPYRVMGPDYNRHIATSAEQLEQMRAQDSRFKHLAADELAVRLEVHGKRETPPPAAEPPAAPTNIIPFKPATPENPALAALRARFRASQGKQ